MIQQNILIDFMLAKIANRAIGLNLRRMQMFGSSGHHHEVHLDKNATWVKFKNDRKLLAFEGIIDTHIQIPKPGNSDPYKHLKENGIISFENLIYNDAYYHDPEHQLHISEPHGYLGGDDPIDERYDIMAVTINAVMVIGGIALLSYLMMDGSIERDKEVDKSIEMSHKITEKLSQQKSIIKNLKDQIQSIQAQLAQK